MNQVNKLLCITSFERNLTGYDGSCTAIFTSDPKRTFKKENKEQANK